ncbi:MAG: diacylglycerol kinase family protein [Candidatus Peribacteraceae bacterium]|nr:diacylglycerol kinase family protein [Candidatus Peribacteraceae bacterium]
MRLTIKSLGHALSGLKHAFVQERNVRKFLMLWGGLAVAALLLKFEIVQWIIFLLVGLCFLTVELINTAIERITDTIDDDRKQANSGHFHPGIKMAKDVAAAASLLALIMFGIVQVLLFLPNILMLFFDHPQA